MEDFKRKELCSLKKDEKVCSTKIFKCFEKFSFILEFLASILLSTLIFKFICNYMHFNCVSKTMLVFIVMVSIIILFLVFFNIKKNKKIENVFLSFMIPLGIMYATFVLVYKVPDEQAHAYRAYNISNFKIIGDTKLQEESVPTQMRSLEDVANYYDEYQLLNVKADYASQSDKEFNVCMTYPPLVYIMPSLTFFVCRMLNINILIAIYLARISNFIMFLFTGWICLKKIPFGKIAVLVYLFMPMMIHQVASISADAFINCISLAFVTYVLYLKFENEKFDKKHKIIFILLAIGLAFTKHIYFPIAFIALILVFDKKLDKKSKAFIIITMALVTIIAVGWFLFSNVYKDVREYILVNEVSLTNQLKYILKNPIIIGIVLGFISSMLNMKYPAIINKTIESLAQTATPIALICIGAGFEGRKALKKIKPTIIATFIKLIGLAAVFIPVAVFLGFRNQELVAALIMLASPTTVTSYVMAKSMDNDEVLSSSIIVLTTVLSSITLTGWIFILRALGLI